VRGRRPKLTYANVVSTLALFVALSGAGAYAASQLPPKSVGEPELRPGAVTADKLRKNAVTAPKIKALAVKQGKIANDAVSVAKLENGAVSGEKLAAGAVTTGKLADGAVTGEKVDESSLGQVPSAAKADFATAAESANPVVFARVNAEGKVDSGFSKGIATANVTVSESGLYCITAPGFTPRGVQVTVEDVGTGNVTATAKVNSGSCPAPQVAVQTYSGLGKVPEPFFVVLYR
jgi:trimeric autotransporter adhesin